MLRRVPERTINLTFHGIGEPARPLEPGEDGVWVSVEQFESLLDTVVGRDDVALSFDDGNTSDLEHALPALRDRGLTATFFVVAGRLGTPNFLDGDGIRELLSHGMEIGCHGMRHRPWRSLDSEALDVELVQARTILESVTGGSVTLAACPLGSYDRRVLRALRDAGYRRAYTSDRGVAAAGDFLQARNSIGPDSGPGIVERIGSADASLARRVKLAVKRWR